MSWVNLHPNFELKSSDRFIRWAASKQQKIKISRYLNIYGCYFFFMWAEAMLTLNEKQYTNNDIFNLVTIYGNLSIFSKNKWQSVQCISLSFILSFYLHLSLSAKSCVYKRERGRDRGSLFLKRYWNKCDSCKGQLPLY